MEEIDNLDLGELTTPIDELLTRLEEYYDNANEEKKAIDKIKKSTSFAYLDKPFADNDTGYSDALLRQFLIKYNENFKRPLERLLITYFRLKANPELQFEGNLLEQPGFKKCTHCHNDEMVELGDRKSQIV